MKVCPRCGSNENFWRGVTLDGWQSVDAELEPTGERDVDWQSAQPDGTLGCSACGWEGWPDDRAELGIDGRPLPCIHPEQQTLEVAA